jgi:hypothetical protein
LAQFADGVTKGTSKRVMANRFEPEVINPRVVQKDKGGLGKRATFSARLYKPGFINPLV